HRVEEFSNFAPDILLFTADAGNRQETLAPGVFRRKVLVHINQWPNQADSSLLGLSDGRQRCDPAVEQDVAQKRFGAVIRGMTEREHGTTKLRNDLVQAVPTMAAAHIAAMGNIVGDQPKGGRVFTDNPLHV